MKSTRSNSRASKPTRTRTSARILAGSIAAFLAVQSAQATAYYWDTNGPTAGFGAITGSWNGLDSFWNTDITGGGGGSLVGATTSSDDLTINGGSTGTITLSGGQSASSFTFGVNVAINLSGSALTIGGGGASSGIFVSATDNAATSVFNGLSLAAAATIQNAGTGVLTISGGVIGTQNLTLNNNGATAGGITIANAFVNNAGSVTNAGSGAGSTVISATIGANVTAVTQNSATSTLSLTGVNLFTGDTKSTLGTLSIGNNLALQNSALDTSGAGVFTLAVTAPVFGGLKGGTNISSAITTGYASVSGLTLNLGYGVTNTYSGVLSNGAAGMTVNKIGLGTQILTGANTSSGTTTITGGTLQVGNGTTGAINGVTGTALTFAGTGTLNVNEAAGSSQGMGALTFSAGDGVIQSTYAGTVGVNATSLTFSSLAGRTAGATGNFVVDLTGGGVNGIDNKIVLTGAAAGFINQGEFFGGSNYAWMNSAGGYVRGIDYTTDTGSYTTAGTASIATSGVAVGSGSTLYVQTTGAVTAQNTATFTTLNIQGDNNFTLASGQTLTVNGILKSGNNGSPTVISGGAALQAAAGSELVVRTDRASDVLTIRTPLAANGGSFTKSGAGTLNITGPGGATGAFTMDGGSLFINNGNLLTSSSVTTGGGNSTAMTITGASSQWTSGALTIGNAGSGNAVTVSSGGTLNSGAVTVGNNALANSNALTVSGNNSNWILGGGLVVGNSGSSNSLAINAGAVVSTSQAVTIGNNAGANANSLTVSGAGSSFSTNSTLNLGVSSSGNSMTISGGANAYVGGVLAIGFNTGANNNSLTVTGPGTSLSTGTYLVVGRQGSSNTLTVSNGASVTPTSYYMGGGPGNPTGGASGNGLIVTGAGSLFSSTSGDFADYAGANMQFLVQNGARASMTGGYFFYYAVSSNGLIQVDGAGSQLTINGNYSNSGQNNTITVSNNGTLYNTGLTTFGGTQQYNVLSGGNMASNSNLALNNSSVLNLNNGTLSATAASVTLVSSGTIKLNGPGNLFTDFGNTTATADIISSPFTGAGSLTKQGMGTMSLTSAASTYTGGTNVNGGTLLFNGAVNLPTTGALSVNAGGTFSLADGTARTTTGGTVATASLALASGSVMAFDWNAGALDLLNVAGTASATGNVGIVINNTIPTGAGGNLLTSTGTSTLNGATYFLANNTNYTATISSTATAVSVGSYAVATPLTNAYWLGGSVGTNGGAMALSTGGTLATSSNWASSAAGTSAGGVVPGGSAVNVIFGATGASQQANVYVGADMNLGGLTFNDTASVTIGGSNGIFLNNTSNQPTATTAALGTVTAGSAITVTPFANATNTVGANLGLFANQTWNIASGKSLVVNGVVSGGGTLTKADAGSLTLNGVNTFLNGVTVSNGTLTLGHATNTLFDNGAITLNGPSAVLALGANSDTVGAVTVSAGSVTGSGTITSTAGLGGFTVTGPYAVSITPNLAGTVGLSKSGGNILTLSGSNTYNLGTSITAGTVVLGHATNTLFDTGAVAVNGPSAVLALGANSDTVGLVTLSGGSITGSGTLTSVAGFTMNNAIVASVSANLGGAVALVKSGTGILTLSGQNTYTGATVLSGGFLNLGSAQGATTGPLGASSVSLPTSSISFGGGTLQYSASNQTDYSSKFAFPVANNAYSIDTNGQTVSFASALLGAGTSGLTKVGTGTLTLNSSAASTYTGATTVSFGTLALDFANAITPTNLLNSGSNLTLAGGTFSLLAQPSNLTAQTVNGLTLNSGGGAISVSNAVTGAPDTLLTLGGITRNAGGFVNFTLPGGSPSATNGIVTTASLTNGILGAWATVGSDWATKSGSNIVAYSSYTDIDALGSTIANGSITNVRMNSAGSSGNITLGATVSAAGAIVPVSINTLLQNTTTAATVDTANKTLNIGGIMLASGQEALTIGASVNDGVLTSLANNGDLTFTNNNLGKILTINSTIVNNGTTTLTKAGAGTLALTGKSVFTGAVSIDAGVVSLQNQAGLGTGAITVTRGAALQIQGTNLISNVFTLSGTGISNDGALRNVSGVNLLSGAITLGNVTRINSDAGLLVIGGATGGLAGAGYALTIGGAGDTSFFSSGVLSGVGTSVTKEGAGTLKMYAGNTYTGLTNLNGGTILLMSGESAGTSGPLGKQAANAGGSIVFGGGTLQFSNGNSNDYSGRFSSDAGQAIKIDTSSQNVTFATGLTSSGGSLTLSAATNSSKLILTGLNTYSGATTVKTGTLELNLNNLLGDNGISSSSALTLGGNLNVIGAGGTLARSQTFASTTFGPGNANLTPTLGAASSLTPALTINLGALSRNSGGTGNIVFTTGNTTVTNTLINTGTGTASSVLTDANGVAYLTFGTSASAVTDWAMKDAGNTKIVQASGIYSTATATAISGNADITNLNPIVSGNGADTAVPTIRFNNGGAQTLTLNNNPNGGGASTYSIGGILITSSVGNNATVITGSGTLRGANAGAGDLVIHNWDASSSTTINLAIGGAGGFTTAGSSTGTTILTAANSFAGPTTIGAGTLQIGNGGLTGDLGGTTGTITDNGTLSIFRVKGSSDLTIANDITGTGSLTQNGSGTTILTGNSTHRGSTTVNNGGTLTFGASSTRPWISNGSSANGTGGHALAVNSGTMNVQGLVSGDWLNIGATSAASSAAVNVSGNGILTVRNAAGNAQIGFSIGGSQSASNAGDYGLLNITGNGIVNALQEVTSNSSTLNGRVVIGSYGTTGLLRIAGGAFNAGELMIGYNNGTSEVTLTSGLFNHYRTGSSFTIASAGTATTVVNVAGGLFDNYSNTFAMGTGTAGSNKGVVNLNAGTLFSKEFTTAAGSQGILNFNGGTWKMGSATSTTVPLPTSFTTNSFSAFVNGAFGSFSGGAVIDTNNVSTTLANQLLAPTGTGITAIAVGNGGAGYVGAPYVTINDAGAVATGTSSRGSNVISGLSAGDIANMRVGQTITGVSSLGIPAGAIIIAVGTNTVTISQNAAPGNTDAPLSATGQINIQGSGATAYATASGGSVTGFVITNPGVGYVSPTVTLSGGTVGGLGYGALVGSISTATNTSGGFTKNGPGTLTLTSGGSTYSGFAGPTGSTFTGNTVINGGNLTIGGTTGGLNLGNYAGNLSIASGALFTYNSAQPQTLSGTISGGGGLTLAGTGNLTLTGNTSTYTGPTNVTGGLLTATQANSLGSTSILSLGASGRFKYAPASASTLTVASLAMVGGSTIGTSFDSTIASTGAASASGTVNLVPSGAYVSGSAYTLLTAASGLFTPSYQVLNATDYTFTLTALPESVVITPTTATALTTAAWKGGLSGATGMWAVSNGSTQSNWQATDGVNQPLVPGGGADVTFSTATSPSTLVGMVLGTDMTVKSVTINNTASAFGLNADGSTLTISPASSAVGITIGAGVQASTIAAKVNLGSAQTWTNNSVNALTVSGIVSGGNALNIAGTNVASSGAAPSAGTIILSGTNTYTGATNINSGSLQVTNALALNTTSAVNLSSGARLWVNVAGANLSKLSTAGGGSGVVAGSILRMDAATLSNPGTIYGILEWNSSLIDWNGSCFIPDLGEGAKIQAQNSSVKSWQTAISFSGSATIDAGTVQFNGNNQTFSASTPGLKALTLTGSGKAVLSGITDGAGQMKVVWNNSNVAAASNQFNNASTFTGGTTILQGVVFNSNATGIGTVNGASLTFGPSTPAGTQFYIGGATTLIGLNTDAVLGANAPTVAPTNSAQTLTINNPVANTFAGTLTNTGAAGAGTLAITKGGAGTLTLSGATRTYTGLTTVGGGTLLWSGANNLAGALTVNAGGTFSTTDGTARNLTTTTLTLASGAVLAFDWNAGAVDNLAPSVAVTPTAAATIGIQINPTNSPTGGPLNLITGIAASTLNNPNYFTANNTNFTATITKPAAGAGSVSIGSFANVGALTNAYWKGGAVTNALGAMALSLGTTSNWASDAAGTGAGGVVPGGNAVNVIFGATGRTADAVTTGADMNLGSLTFNDGTAVTLAGSNFLTLNSTSGTAASTSGALATVTAGSAVSVTSFANATNTISAGVVVNSAQTWNIDTGKTLAVSGVLTGASTNSLTLKGGGTLTLSGANTFAGSITIDNTISGTTLKMGGANALGAGTGSALNIGSVTVSGSGAALDLAGQTLSANATRVGEILILNGTGIASNGALSNSTNAAGTYAGLVQLGSASTIVAGTGSNANASIILSNPLTITGAGFALTLDGLATATSRIDSIIGTTTGTLTKQGAGIWALTAPNTYSGTTTISAGTLQLGNAGATGAINPASSVVDNGTLTISRTNTATQGVDFGTITSGTGGVTQSGAGTTIFNAANVYSGTTLVTNGTIKLGASNVVPSASALNVNGLGGAPVFDLNGFNNTVASITLQGQGGSATTNFGLIKTNGGVLTTLGNITMNVNNLTNSGNPSDIQGFLSLGNGIRTISNSGQTSVISALISGGGASGGLILNNGTTVFYGANTYSGGTTLNGNFAVGVDSVGTTGSITSGPLGTGPVTINNGGGISAWSYNQNVFLGNIPRTILNPITIAAASPTVNFGSATFALGKVILSNTVDLGGSTPSINIVSGVSAQLDGIVSNGSITANGSGTLILSNPANSFTGTATINNGTMQWGASSVMPSANSVSLGSGAGSTFDLNGFNQTIASLTLTGTGPGTGGTVKTAAGTLTLTNGIVNNMFNGTTSVITGNLGLNGTTQTFSMTGQASTSTTISAAISNGGVNIIGGNWTFSGVNTFSGDTKVNANTLTVSNNLALQNSALDTSGAGTVALTVTTPTFGGLKGATDLASVITVGYGTTSALTLNPATGVTNTYSGGIVNGATGMTLTKTGLGTQALSGTNTYTGVTTVSVGTLLASSSTALGTSAAGTTVSTGATLDVQANIGIEEINVQGVGVGGNGALVAGAGTGTIGGTITLAGSTSIGGAGTLNINGVVSTGGNTVSTLGVGVTNFGTASTLTSLASLAVLDGTTNVNSALGTSGNAVVNVSDTVGGNPTTLKFGSVSQTLSSLTIGAGSTVTFTGGEALGSFSGGSKVSGFVGASTVPEPGTIGLLLVGALGFVNRRRRQA